MKILKAMSIFVFSIIIIFYYSSCKSKEGTAVESVVNSTVQNETSLKLSKSLSSVDKLKEIAKGLAILMKDKEYRIILQDAISASKNYEQILIAPDFFNKINQDGKKNKSIATYLSGKEKIELDSYLNNLVRGVIDIYFPFPDHRKNYNADQEILVAPVTKSLISNGMLMAYNSRGGEVEISSKEPNKVPTLVVCFSEKNGIYNEEELKRIHNDRIPPQKPLSKVNSSMWYFNAKYVLIENNYDGGILGNMEVYARASNEMYYTNNWSGWHGGYYDNHSFGTVSPGVRKEMVPAANLGCAYFGNARYVVEIWEYDDWFSGGDDRIADSYWNDAYVANFSNGDQVSYYGANINYIQWSFSLLKLHDAGGSNDNDYLWVYGDSN